MTRQKVLRFYRDDSGMVRWQFKAANGRVQADSAEGYVKLAAAEAGAVSLLGGDLARYGHGLSRSTDGRHGGVDGRPDVRVEWDL